MKDINLHLKFKLLRKNHGYYYFPNKKRKNPLIEINSGDVQLEQVNTFYHEISHFIFDLLSKNKIVSKDSKKKNKMDTKDYKVVRREVTVSDEEMLCGKIGMHRLILGIVDNIDIDHLDRDPLNNRRSNIRFCTHQDNMKNKFYKNNKYGYPGVGFAKNVKRYRAYISVNKKHINLGYYDELEDAINARKEAEEKYKPKTT